MRPYDSRLRQTADLRQFLRYKNKIIDREMFYLYDYQKRRTETFCLTTETWRLVLDDFSAYIA